MIYTEELMNELENLEFWEKTDSLTEVGKKRIAELRKCRDDFTNLSDTILTIDEKIWLNKIVWFYENEKGFDEEDITKQKSIFSKLKID